MRERVTVACLSLVVLLLGGAAMAGVPGWATAHQKTKVDVASCSSFAAKAEKAVTGKTPTTTKMDKNNFEIRSSTTNEGIFLYCTAAATDICPNRPAAMLTILTFSSAGSGQAAAVRDQVKAQFGNPVLIDCNP